jgi:hypothetical protein
MGTDGGMVQKVGGVKTGGRLGSIGTGRLLEIMKL